MKQEKTIAALFDFDGVVVDTEPQYTLFWDVLGKKYHPEIPEFGHHIKGQTLTQIYSQYFLQPEGLQNEIQLNAVLPIACIVGVGIYVLSWYLSVVFYKKREL